MVDTQKAKNSLTLAFSRFELEEALVACFNIADDMSLVCEEVLEGNVGPDEIANMLQGLAEVHKLRCDKAFRIFSYLVEHGKIQ